jgi:hypothetical protein
VSAEIIGMAVSPWLVVTFTLRRWTLFAIALCGGARHHCHGSGTDAGQETMWPNTPRQPNKRQHR